MYRCSWPTHTRSTLRGTHTRPTYTSTLWSTHTRPTYTSTTLMGCRPTHIRCTTLMGCLPTHTRCSTLLRCPPYCTQCSTLLGCPPYVLHSVHQAVASGLEATVLHSVQEVVSGLEATVLHPVYTRRCPGSLEATTLCTLGGVRVDSRLPPCVHGVRRVASRPHVHGVRRVASRPRVHHGRYGLASKPASHVHRSVRAGFEAS